MQQTDYQIAKEVSTTLEVFKEMVVTPAIPSIFRKYLRDFKGDKEFVTKTTSKGLTVTRLK